MATSSLSASTLFVAQKFCPSSTQRTLVSPFSGRSGGFWRAPCMMALLYGFCEFVFFNDLLYSHQIIPRSCKKRSESAVQGEIAAEEGLTGAAADMEIRRCEQTNSEIALCESHRELESQRSQKITTTSSESMG